LYRGPSARENVVQVVVDNDIKSLAIFQLLLVLSKKKHSVNDDFKAAFLCNAFLKAFRMESNGEQGFASPALYILKILKLAHSTDDCIHSSNVTESFCNAFFFACNNAHVTHGIDLHFNIVR